MLTYAASCATKHSSSYNVLLVGRLLGGVSTSLLFSVFEAWAVAAHTSRGFEESLLVSTAYEARREGCAGVGVDPCHFLPSHSAVQRHFAREMHCMHTCECAYMPTRMCAHTQIHVCTRAHTCVQMEY